MFNCKMAFRPSAVSEFFNKDEVEDSSSSGEETSFDELLISEVYQKEALWNKAEYYFRNADVRNQMWETIGQKFKLSGAECKTRWTYLREKFRREYKKIQENSQKAPKIYAKWPNFVSLTFLKVNYENRSTVSNLKPALSESDCDYEDVEYLDDIHDTVEAVEGRSSGKIPATSKEQNRSKNTSVTPNTNKEESLRSSRKVRFASIDKGHSTDKSEDGNSNSEIYVSSEKTENRKGKGPKKKISVNAGQAKRTKNNLSNKKLRENASNSDEYISSEETADEVSKKPQHFNGKPRSKFNKKMTAKKWTQRKPIRDLTLEELAAPGTSNRQKRNDKVTSEQNTSLKSAITDINNLVHGVLQAPQEAPKINQNHAFCTYLQSEMETFSENENWNLRKVVLTHILQTKERLENN